MNWQRIGAHDYAVPGIGRVYRHDGGPQDGKWFWSCLLYNPPGSGVATHGVAPARDQAMAAVRRAHDALQPAGGEMPQRN
ncbi:hypothetical protein [Oricola cellulosilytica]|uniref:DUF4102 domain-containing protein n=1 Tax=Oricola cellulosilytica TaxID=1429082 RepID=A0A4R0PD09_9HYPH|nr:hypothetical protein [Oricola cellulosilytica]TCD15176.1 hypothetical protein E0D97_06400 [Oricola cellulosilytica]